MEAHNGKTRMHSSDVPLVVKFADAKRKEDRLGFGRGRLGMDWQEQMKRLQLAGNLNEYAAQVSMLLHVRTNTCWRAHCCSRFSVVASALAGSCSSCPQRHVQPQPLPSSAVSCTCQRSSM